MAVGNEPLPDFFAVKGVEIGTANAGIKQTERDDVTVFRLSEKSLLQCERSFCIPYTEKNNLEKLGKIKLVVGGKGTKLLHM